MPCRRCEEMRKALGRIWRTALRRQCSIPGCDKQANAYLCERHWRGLPLSVRVRYWEETNYGQYPPSQHLINEAVEALRMDNRPP